MQILSCFLQQPDVLLFCAVVVLLSLARPFWAQLVRRLGVAACARPWHFQLFVALSNAALPQVGTSVQWHFFLHAPVAAKAFLRMALRY